MKMKTQTKEKEKKEGLVFSDVLASSLVCGFIFAFVYGIFIGKVGGLVLVSFDGIIYGFMGGFLGGVFLTLFFVSFFGLILGLVVGLVVGLSVSFITQLIALLTSNPEFAMFDLIASGVLLVLVQLVGWLTVLKLKEKGK